MTKIALAGKICIAVSMAAIITTLCGCEEGGNKVGNTSSPTAITPVPLSPQQTVPPSVDDKPRDNRPRDGTPQVEKAPPPAAGPGRHSVVATVMVDDLLADYEANEVNADMKYKNQWITVIGTCVRVGKDESGREYVLLRGETRFRHAGVMCYFKAGFDLGIVKADSICTFHGICTHRTGVSIGVVMNDCEFQTKEECEALERIKREAKQREAMEREAKEREAKAREAREQEAKEKAEAKAKNAREKLRNETQFGGYLVARRAAIIFRDQGLKKLKINFDEIDKDNGITSESVVPIETYTYSRIGVWTFEGKVRVQVDGQSLTSTWTVKVRVNPVKNTWVCDFLNFSKPE
jgi:hypothetical protein